MVKNRGLWLNTKSFYLFSFDYRRTKDILSIPSPYKGWLAWKKISHQLDNNRFLMFIQPDEEGKTCYDLFFVDILKTAAILAENYDYFKKITGMDFDPIAIVYEIKDPQSQFWNRVFRLETHLAKGLLFGYGKKNSLLFEYRLKHLGKDHPLSKKIMNIHFPTSFNVAGETKVQRGQGNFKNFTIPRFGVVDRTDVRKYQEEKKEIESYYKGKKFIQATLEKLINIEE